MEEYNCFRGERDRIYVNECTRSGLGRLKVGITVPILRVYELYRSDVREIGKCKMGDEMAHYECDDEGMLDSQAMLV